MRVALISDLHGNAVALDAVLADVGRAGADEIVCLGDVASLGPQPREVLRTLRELGCVCIMGNHDANLIDPANVREIPIIAQCEDWCRARLDADDLDLLRGFRPSHELALADGASLFLFHGTPRSFQENLLATTPPDEVDAMLDGRRATILAGGHTHIQLVRQHRGALIVNPGSVGMPFREWVGLRPPEVMPWAEYAIVWADATGGLGAELRRVTFDVQALCAAIAATDLPLGPSLLAAYARA